MTAPSISNAARRRARTAYELARVRLGAIRAVALAAVVVATSLASLGLNRMAPNAYARFSLYGIAWLALTAIVWTATEWRGGAFLRGGRVGAGVGLIALVVPMWAFRSCCRAGDAMMGAGCCNMTGACSLVGIALGLTLAVFLVRAPREKRMETALGMGVALLAVASVRCASMLAGEALGLMAGLAAGAAASSLVAAFVDRARRTA